MNKIDSSEPKAKKIKVKRTKVKRIKTQSTAKSLGTIIAALFFTLLIFAGLIYLNNFVTEEVSYQTVIVAKVDIPENFCLTEENAYDYFTLKSIDITILPKNYVSSLENHLGEYTFSDISKNEIITTKDFKELSTDKFKNPVEVSLALDNLGNSICGKLRAGDVINMIINTKTNNGISDGSNRYEDVIVTGAYDNSCIKIAAGDTTTNTSYITFNIEKDNEQELNEILIYANSIRISRKLK